MFLIIIIVFHTKIQTSLLSNWLLMAYQCYCHSVACYHDYSLLPFTTCQLWTIKWKACGKIWLHTYSSPCYRRSGAALRATTKSQRRPPPDHCDASWDREDSGPLIFVGIVFLVLFSSLIGRARQTCRFVLHHCQRHCWLSPFYGALATSSSAFDSAAVCSLRLPYCKLVICNIITAW